MANQTNSSPNHFEATGLGVFAESLQTNRPSYSRYCMYRAKEFNSFNKDATLKPHCKMCYTILTSENHKVRLAPRMPLTKKLKKLLDIYASSATSSAASSAASSSVTQGLSRCQKKIVKRYLNSSNALVISCSTCGKSTKIKCQGRSCRVRQLMSWKPTPEKTEIEVSPKTKKKKKNKKSSVIMSPAKPLSKHQSSNQQQPISADPLRSAGHEGPIGTPLITSTPMASNDSGIADCSKSFISCKTDILIQQECSKPSPVFALLGGNMSPSLSGVKKKKKKGKNKHQHLEKLLHKQKLTDNESKNGKKNSLAAFLSELTY